MLNHPRERAEPNCHGLLSLTPGCGNADKKCLVANEQTPVFCIVTSGMVFRFRIFQES